VEICSNPNFKQKLLTKHNIKEKQKMQTVKSISIHRNGGVSSWKSEELYRKKSHHAQIAKNGTNIKTKNQLAYWSAGRTSRRWLNINYYTANVLPCWENY